jgi:hypothetical protein
MYLRKYLKIKSTMLFEFHSSPTTRNKEFTKTYEKVKYSFFWDGMKHDIHTIMVECDTYQCNKGEISKYLGTLQPLPILHAIWRNIFMDFIV